MTPLSSLPSLADLAPNPDWATLPLFDRSGWKRVRFGEVVENINETCDPAAAGLERFVAMEHLEPGSLHVRSWGNVADGTTFTRRCRPEQVLFGKRRAYQRKVAVADFEAVVSGDIYVLTPKDDRLLAALLPFLCLSERFFEHAVGTSAGSLSPRTNWSSLASFQFDLPPRHLQHRITELLSSADNAKLLQHEAAQAAWSTLDVKLNQYVGPRNNDSKRLGDYFTVKHGWPFEGKHFNDTGRGSVLLTPGNFSLTGELNFTPKNTKFYAGDFPDEYLLQGGELVAVMTDLTPTANLLGMPALVEFGRIVLHNQRIGRLQFDTGKIDPRYAYYMLLSDAVRSQIRKTASGSTVRHTSPSRILETTAFVPTLEHQAKVVADLDNITKGLAQIRRCYGAYNTGQQWLTDTFSMQDFPSVNSRSC